MSTPKTRVKSHPRIPELSEQQLQRMKQNITAYAIDRGFDPRTAREIVSIFVDEQRPRSNNEVKK